jgi:TPR repeat protein
VELETREKFMKISLIVIALLVSAVSVVRARYVTPTAVNPLNQAGTYTPEQQMQTAIANQQWQAQQNVTVAKKVASQAAEFAKQAAAYAKQVSDYTNEAAKETVGYAETAADYARQAQYDASPNSVLVFNGLASVEKDADNAKQAAGKAEISSVVAGLEHERDVTIAKARAIKYNPSITDLESQAAAFNRKAESLEVIKNSFFVTNFNVKPGPNHRVVNAQTYDINRSDLWGSPSEMAGFQSHANENFRLLTYLAKVETVDRNKIQCGVYAQAHWPPVANGEVESENMVQEIVIYHYPNAESLVSGQLLGDCRCMRVGNYNDHGISYAAFDCGVQATKGVTEVVPGSPDAATLKSIEDNIIQLSAVKLKLSQVEGDFDKERESIVAESEAKIIDVPNVLAKKAKDKADAKKQTVVDKVVKYNQDLADKGDEYGLLRMGERYRDGDGVPKDLAKAKDYLTRAAAAGSPTAADELKALPGD